MTILFIYYPKCGTCIKAKKWLEENKISFEMRHIVEHNPTKDELAKWIQESGLPSKKFFNTSGKLYKDLELSKKLPTLTLDEQLDLLSSNGMMVKRPIVLGDGFILVGFKEAEWNEKLK